MPTTLTAADTHTSSVFFAAPFDAVWSRVTDPEAFPTLYPDWASAVERAGRGAFRGTDPTGDEFTVYPHLDREFGIADLEVVDEGGASEFFRSRLFPVGETACVLVHLTVRRPRLSDDEWADHRRRIDDDLRRAKAVVEGEFSGGQGR
ncbi:hypothetical protein [Halomarina pelagica]|uniref:hypothetical protein n=1 Tax=Halomarina pelagica TaxID=2961599 RepID=UPI0020C250A8|nr:hypothetical protein [Halomarina sp. BND7]